MWSGVLNVGAAGGTVNVDNTNTTNNNLYFDAGMAGSGTLTLNTTGGSNNGIVFRTAAGSYTGHITLDSGTTFINGSAGRTFQNATVDLRERRQAHLQRQLVRIRDQRRPLFRRRQRRGRGTNLNTQSVFHLGTSNGNGSYSGDITGAGFINKLGAGTQILNSTAPGHHRLARCTCKGSLELVSDFSKTTNDLL